MRATGIKTRWVNSDRQLADVLTKPTAPASSIQRLQQTGRWKIVWDANYTSAKNLRKEKREKHFKNKNKKADNADSAAGQEPVLPSGSSVDNDETADAVATVVNIIENSNQPAAVFPDFEVINFVTELDPGMSAQSSRKRSTSPTSRELAARVEQLKIDTDDEYEKDQVVCTLNFEEHAMTDESNPHNEIQHQVSAPHLHQDPRIVTTLEDGSIDLENTVYFGLRQIKLVITQRSNVLLTMSLNHRGALYLDLTMKENLHQLKEEKSHEG